MSYREKSIWGQLIATLIVYGNYFARSGGNLIGMIVVLVMIQIVAQIAIAILAKPEPKDERDRLIDARAYRVGYLLLVTGAVLCMNIVVSPTVNGLLMALVVSEVGKSVTQLYYYRWGV